VIQVLNKKAMNDMNNTKFIYGWNDINEVALSVWSSLHDILLSGNLIFAYRGKDISQLIVVDDAILGSNSYSFGIITNDYTMLVPHMPLEYVREEILSELKNHKVDTNIIKTFEYIVEKHLNE
jgi:hypothetical protein